MSRTCTRCGEDKPLEEFGLDRRNRSGRKSWCKGCNSEHQSATGASTAWTRANAVLRKRHPAEWAEAFDQERRRLGLPPTKRRGT